MDVKLVIQKLHITMTTFKVKTNISSWMVLLSMVGNPFKVAKTYKKPLNTLIAKYS